MYTLLLTPPLAFIIILSAIMLFMYLSSKLAYRSKKHVDGSTKSYACGEDTYNNLAQPDYSNFFPFVFFFTLAHVATLIIATVPIETLKTFDIAIIYIMGTIIGLSILLKEQI